MSNFLTDGRRALLAAFQADATLSAKVRTWFDWGPGIRRRYNLEPARCPAFSLAPAELDEDQIANVSAGFPQDLAVGIATDGADAEPCEELVAAAFDVIRAGSRTCLGLAADGITGLEVRSAQWAVIQEDKDPRPRWEAEIIVRVNWMRRT